MNKASLAVAILSATTLAACADLPQQSQLPPTMTIAAATTTTISDGNVAAPPPGFVSFCMHNIEACTAKPSPATTVALNDETRAKLIAVNEKINDAIVYETDQEQYGVANLWTLDPSFGNCKDYALSKQKELIAEGFPAQALRIAIVRTPQDELHAVLTVDTDHGDFVLDSLTSEIKPWSQTEYRWLTRQSAQNPIRWEHVAPQTTLAYN